MLDSRVPINPSHPLELVAFKSAQGVIGFK